jgi:hypothetical protein
MDTIKDMDSVESLYEWINQVFHDDFLTNILGIINKRPRTIDETKRSIIFGMLISILQKTYNDIYIVMSMTPWNIKEMLEKDEKAGRYFGIPANNTGNTVLPVTVIMGKDIYIHEMTNDCVLGILAFYNMLNQQHPLSMYGYTFVDYNEKLLNMVAPQGDFSSGYTVNVGNVRYIFNDIEFMKGLLTGASWNNLDPYLYITNLKQWTVERMNAGYRIRKAIDLTY